VVAFGALFTLLTSVMVFLDYRFGGASHTSEQFSTAGEHAEQSVHRHSPSCACSHYGSSVDAIYMHTFTIVCGNNEQPVWCTSRGRPTCAPVQLATATVFGLRPRRSQYQGWFDCLRYRLQVDVGGNAPAGVWYHALLLVSAWPMHLLLCHPDGLLATASHTTCIRS
jgi:hypothetical protein